MPGDRRSYDEIIGQEIRERNVRLREMLSQGLFPEGAAAGAEIPRDMIEEVVRDYSSLLGNQMAPTIGSAASAQDKRSQGKAFDKLSDEEIDALEERIKRAQRREKILQQLDSLLQSKQKRMSKSRSSGKR